MLANSGNVILGLWQDTLPRKDAKGHFYHPFGCSLNETSSMGSNRMLNSYANILRNATPRESSLSTNSLGLNSVYLPIISSNFPESSAAS